MELILNSKVPVLNLTVQDLKPNTPTWHSVSKEVSEALEAYGCFVAVYDRVTQQLESLSAAEELFGLPTETKKKNVKEKPYHGYTSYMDVFPLLESLGIDYVTNKEDAQRFTHLMWPQGNDRFWIHSCEHRVTMAGDMTRYTLALFSFVRGMVSAPEELVDDEHPLMYKPFHNIALISFYTTKESCEAKSTLKAYCGIQKASMYERLMIKVIIFYNYECYLIDQNDNVLEI